MEGEPPGGRGTEGVDCGRQHHLHEVEVLGGDLRKGTHLHHLGVPPHDLLGEVREFVAAEVIEVLRIVAGRIELQGELVLGRGDQVVPLGEGVAVRDILLGIVGTAVNSDVAELRQLEEGEGDLE